MSDNMERVSGSSNEPMIEEETMMVEWPDAFDYQDPKTGVVIRFRNRTDFIKWQEDNKQQN